MNPVLNEISTRYGSLLRRSVKVIVFSLAAVALPMLAPQAASAQFGDVTLAAPPVSGSSLATPGLNLTWSHTVPDSTNRLLVVTIATHRTSAILANVNSITYAGSPMTAIIATQGNAQDLSKRTEIWVLVAPPIGAANVVVNMSGVANVVGASYSFASVDQAAPVFNSGNTAATNTASDSAATLAICPPAFTRSAIVDVIAVEATNSATPVAGQANVHSQVTTDPNPGDRLLGRGGSVDPPTGLFNVMQYSLGVNDFWVVSTLTLNPAALTGIGLESFDATAYSGIGADGRAGGVTLTWRSGAESNNLGYRVVRERDGIRTPVSRDLIAGSALFTASNLSSGYRFGAHDRDGRAGDHYYLEDVDFSGRSTLHGPYATWQGVGKSTMVADSPTLSDINHASSGSRLIWADEPDRANGKGGNAGGGGTSTQWQLANSPAVKIGVRETGWYRISPATLASAGVNLGSTDPRTFRLFNGGREVAIRVSGEADGRFDLSDAIEFYGTAVDSQATDTQMYWLTTSTGKGLRMKVQPRGPATGAAVSFPAVAEIKERFVYFASLENGERENFFGQVVTAEPADHPLMLTNVDPAGSGAVVEVSLQGVTLVPHRVTVTVNGQSVGELAYSDKKAGFARFAIPSSLLVEGVNVVSLATSEGAVPTDVSLVDAVRIGYSHKARADQNVATVNVAGRSGARTFDGFTNSQIRAFDVTNPSAVQELSGAVAPSSSSYRITVQPLASTRRLLVTTPDRALEPASISLNRPSTWNAATNRADVVYITHRDFAESVEPLKALRESQGYSVAVVDVEDLFDEFSNGVESPAAIRSFVARARLAWSVKPTFVTLVGDGSLDPKDYLGAGDFSFVPSKLIDASAIEMASDDWLVDGNGDDLPDVAVGRLPVRTVAEASALVAKIIAYESSGSTNRTAMLVSDQTDISDFLETTNDIRGLLPSDYLVSQVVRGADTDAATRQAVQSGANVGPGIVNYVGHGSVDVWRGNLMNAGDAGALVNAGRLSVYVVGNCLNGYYQDPNLESLGEALLKSPNGAVAVWASSGATGPEGQRVLLREFYASLFNGPSITLGEAAAQAKAAAAGDVRRSWVLLGDSATRLH